MRLFTLCSQWIITIINQCGNDSACCMQKKIISCVRNVWDLAPLTVRKHVMLCTKVRLQHDPLRGHVSQYILHKWIVLFARSDWLTRRWLASTIHLRAPGARDFKISDRLSHKITFWSANYSACVVYTKTIIHLSVGESDGYLPPLRWTIVNYCINKYFLC